MGFRTLKDGGDNRILFSVQDLFGYLKAHPTMSGIQRVQAGIALHAMETDEPTVGFLLNELTEHHRDGEFLLIDSAPFRAIIEYASGEQIDHERLREMLADCERGAVRFRPQAGDTIILLGAFWGHGNTIDRYIAARRAGVTIGGYVYDIIPITHPEYCDEALSRDFAMSLAEFVMVVDFIFTISDFTGRVLADLLRENGCRTIPIRTVPLAHSMTVAHGGSPVRPVQLRRLGDRPYVAYVSTVEGRKNHTYVVQAWQQMIAEGVDVPDLVFVGRRGWRINGLLDLLDGTRNLGGRVHIVHGLTDAELAGVYEHCLFTVFTSFVEGWGLPVGESLVHGVCCAASNASSIPEVGGEFVDYLDPLSVRDGITVLRRLIEDGDYRRERQRAIRDSFMPRTWGDVGRDFLQKTKEAIAVPYPIPDMVPFLPEGRYVRLGDLATGPIVIEDYLPSPIRMALRECFYQLEAHGSWMKGSQGSLTFRTKLPPGTDVVVYVEITPAPTANGQDVQLIVGGAPPTFQAYATCKLDKAQRNLVRGTGQVDSNGHCTVTLQLSEDIYRQENDSRTFAIGLVAIGYAAVGNAALREDLFERFVFRDLSSNC